MNRPIALAFFMAAAAPGRLLAQSAPVLSSELRKTAQDSFKAYQEGRLEDAASGYRYLITLGELDAAPTVNLALALKDAGKAEEASAQWLRATILDSSNPYLWNQRAWNYLSTSRYSDAREAFAKAIAVSSGSIFAAEAYLGMGLAESLDGNIKKAFLPLQNSVIRNPYLLPAAAAELGRLALRLHHPPEALPFLTMSLSQDQLQPDVAVDLGQTYEKTSQMQAAWQAYKLAHDLDPFNPLAAARLEKIPHFLLGRPTDAMPLKRLARPLMRDPKAEPLSEPLRIALFAHPDGRPAHVTHFYFMTSSDFRVADVKLGEVNRGKATVQWEVIFQPENRVIELRDLSNNVLFVTKQPFRIEPLSPPGGTVLIKNPQMADLTGIDPSDREFRGAVEVIPTPTGFHMVNEVPIEEYLFSAVGQALPQGSPLEAYKAMAVLTRSRVLAMKSRASPNAERTDLCDGRHCLLYPGLTNESAKATRAVRETRGVVLKLPAGADFAYHASCGWATAAGVQDWPVPRPGLSSPYDLELLLHSYPDPESFDEASAQVPALWIRWLRVLTESELRRRVERVKYLGTSIRHVRIARRSPEGRVLALEVAGTRDKVLLEGEDAITDFLSPGSLRSTLFALQPIYRGKELDRLLVWGAGTGHGRGLCMAGAMGQAHLGQDYRSILAHYFPGSSLAGVPAETPKKAASAPKKAGKSWRKHLAFPRRPAQDQGQ